MNIIEWGRKWFGGMDEEVHVCRREGHRNTLRVMLDERGKPLWSIAEFREPLTKARYESQQEGLNKWWKALTEEDKPVMLIVGPPGWDVVVSPHPTRRHCHCHCHEKGVPQ
jgi:hypothetical protein